MKDFYSLISSLKLRFPLLDFDILPWLHITDVEKSYADNPPISNLSEFGQQENVWTHPSATIEKNVTIKGFAIISENCFIAANSYLRGGVILGPNTHVGPGTELKSVICSGNTAFAHFNYVGNSLIGANVNFEAGSVVANHLNEAVGTTIKVMFDSQMIDTGQLKFGALVGDGCKIGANAVLSPGTILAQNTVVPRLALVQHVSL
jgi:UDP-N-acetylglucosamine diphosphorylase / glucose-1-phosphate thymidylyltransferase / UDP-N-acetylgalactosamine diphosphorylase / glucosamine-1-phosphate N-acetyltransferase / galactosamine-1-phosphate N-acetyltransferase